MKTLDVDSTLSNNPKDNISTIVKEILIKEDP